LYLVHRVPHPPNRGDRIRSYHILRFLAERADVYLACLADEAVSAETRAVLDRHAARAAIVPLSSRGRWLRAAGSLARGQSATEGLFRSPELKRIVGQWSREMRFDAVLAFCSSMAPYLDVAGLAGVPTCVDLVDVDSQKWLDYAQRASGARAWLFRLEAGRVRRLERSLARRVDSVTVVSDAEAAILKSFCPAANAHAIGNGVDLDYFCPTASDAKSDRPECVFVGALDYRANIDGICWFCAEVWPRLRSQVPDAVLSIVGRRPDPAVRRLANCPGVELIGEVPDVRPYLARARVAVVPLRIARGIQNKVIEAMAAGTPVVASPQALEGLRLTPGEHALQADSPAQWTAAIADLLSSEASRRRLAAAGRAFVEEHHRWETCLRQFELLLNLNPAATMDGNGAGQIPARLGAAHA